MRVQKPLPQDGAGRGTEGRGTEGPGGADTRGAPRWMKWALVASLLVNMVAIGVLGGAVLRGFLPMPPRPPILGEIGFGPYTEALDQDQRQALRRAFALRGADLRRLRAAVGDDFTALLAVLRADPYDPAAARAIVDRQSDRLRGGMEIGQDLLLDRIAAMPLAERRAFADRLVEALKHPPRPMGGPRGEGGRARDQDRDPGQGRDPGYGREGQDGH